MSQYIIVAFGCFMGVMAIILLEIGLNLGWALALSACLQLNNVLAWFQRQFTAEVALVGAMAFLSLRSTNFQFRDVRSLLHCL